MPILGLEQAKAALSIRDANTDRDTLVVEFSEAVDAVVEQYIGNWVARREITIDVPPGGILPGTNVVSLMSGEYIDGSGPVDVSGMSVSSAGILTGASGSSLPSGAWRLTLQVGLDEIPAAIKRGAAEILIEAWKTQQGGDAAGAFLVPFRAAAWLDPFSLVSIA